MQQAAVHTPEGAAVILEHQKHGISRGVHAVVVHLQVWSTADLFQQCVRHQSRPVVQHQAQLTTASCAPHAAHAAHLAGTGAACQRIQDGHLSLHVHLQQWGSTVRVRIG